MPAATILAHLQALEAERRRRAADTTLNQKVVAVKAFQQRRFSLTYADLLASPRYGAAARFFLEELYGPNDFANATPSSRASRRPSHSSSPTRSPPRSHH